MTQGSTQYPQYQAPRPSNGLGIAGFILSIVGIFTGGILAPIALLLSFLALFRAPRGFAFAGFIVSLLGTLFLAAWLSFFGILGFGCVNFSKPYFTTVTAMAQCKEQINLYASAHAGALPGEAEGNTIIAGFPDGWGHPMHFVPHGAGGFDIQSAGPDGAFGSPDDVFSH